MPDIFISYSSKNRPSAQRLAEALSARGWSVWWDREIHTGQVYHQMIEQALHDARAVVVLWTTDSVQSEWVKNEAAVAVERGVMLPANLDGTRLPLEFRSRQTVDLAGWDGDAAHEGFAALCRSVHRLLSDPDDAAVQPASDMSPDRPGKPGHPAMAFKRPWLRAGLAAGGVLALAAMFLTHQAPQQPVQPVQPGPGHVATPASQGAGALSFDQLKAAMLAESARQLETSRRLNLLQEATLATAVGGVYLGDVVSDANGGSRSAVVVTITPLATGKVRMASNDPRLGSVDIDLRRDGAAVTSAVGNHALRVDVGTIPFVLAWKPHSALAFVGQLQL